MDCVKKEVYKLLKNENSGHGIDHIERVLNLSIKFSNKIECNKDLVILIALLHDVDDYKLFGKNNEKNQTHAIKILDKCNIRQDYKKIVLKELRNIGYSKRILGKKPSTIEGKIVSDSDMCDAIGANGILRIYKYGLKINRPFFDKNIYPNLDNNHYISKGSKTGINHFFEKILKLNSLMLTVEGEKEAQKREKIMVDFLYEYFNEEEVEEWIEYLNNYLK